MAACVLASTNSSLCTTAVRRSPCESFAAGVQEGKFCAPPDDLEAATDGVACRPAASMLLPASDGICEFGHAQNTHREPCCLHHPSAWPHQHSAWACQVPHDVSLSVAHHCRSICPTFPYRAHPPVHIPALTSQRHMQLVFAGAWLSNRGFSIGNKKQMSLTWP